jgi:hypothetical protein
VHSAHLAPSPVAAVVWSQLAFPLFYLCSCEASSQSMSLAVASGLRALACLQAKNSEVAETVAPEPLAAEILAVRPRKRARTAMQRTAYVAPAPHTGKEGAGAGCGSRVQCLDVPVAEKGRAWFIWGFDVPTAFIHASPS